MNVRRLMSAVSIAIVMALAGCKADLYTGLTEKSANDMLAVLLANDIPASKKIVGDKGVTLQVDESDLLAALDVLSSNGYPKVSRENMGKVFAKSGVMSSPFEERVRYTYALGEEVAKTLSEIDGVLAARVHIVMPETPELGQKAKPASAAVFIKHDANKAPNVNEHDIKSFVADAIEGLDYKNVTVLLSASETPVNTRVAALPATQDILGVKVTRDDAPTAWMWIEIAAGVILALALVSLASLYLLLRRGGAQRSSSVEVGVPGE